MGTTQEHLSVVDNKEEGMSLNTSECLKENAYLQEQYTRNWLWRTLAAFIEVESFNPSPIWISERLNVSIKDVVLALEGLEKLGIIKRTEKGYERILKFVYFSDRDLNPKHVLSDHLLVSTQIHSRLDPINPRSGSFYRTGFVTSNETLKKEFCEKIEKIMKEFLEKSSRSEKEEVYAFTFSNVNILENGE